MGTYKNLFTSEKSWLRMRLEPIPIGNRSANWTSVVCRMTTKLTGIHLYRRHAPSIGKRVHIALI